MGVAVLTCLALGPFAWVSGGAHSQPAALLHVWVDAGRTHIPGQADNPALAVGDWTKDQLLWILNHVDDAPSPNRAINYGAVLHLDIALHVQARAAGNLFPSYPRTGPPPPSTPFLVVDGTGTGSGASSTHLGSPGR